MVGTSFFPRYLEPFAPERIVDGRARAAAAAAPTPTSRDAEPSVLKIRGTNDCGRGVEGTGFLYADDRLMTNAHVVAGVDDPEVEIGGGIGAAPRSSTTTPTSTSPCSRSTTASLPTPGLRPRRPRPQDGVAILGYPQDGPYDVQAGRIRAEQRLRSPDIYGDGTRASARCSRCAGWSGPATPAARSSPRPATSSGVVFAASVTDRDTGYALTADQVAAERRASGSTDHGRRCRTGDCAG